MEKNLSTIIRQLIDAVWRRRILLFVPLLVMLPLSILAAKFLPRTYIATSLMVMQESNRDNPFVQNNSVDYSLVKRIEGLEAWLKSDHVLTQVISSFSKIDADQDPIAFAVEIREFREALKLDLIGNDFLKFSLSDSNRHGLGKKLEAVTTRFLEGLLIPDDRVQSATQAVLQHHRDRLQEIRQRQIELGQSPSSGSPDLKSRSKNSLMKNQKERLDKLRQAYEQNNTRLTKLSPGELTNKTDGLVDGSASSLNIAGGELVGGKIYDRKNDLQKPTSTGNDGNEISKKRGLLNQQEQLIRLRLAAAMRQLNDVNIRNPLGILNAPEGIKIIDAAKDPVRPATSGLKILIAGLAGAIFLGVGLASMAELTDQRLFDETEIAELTGVKIIAHLPNIDRAKNQNGKNPSTG